MYELVVHHPGPGVATERVKLARSSDVLDMIPRLLARHHGCERIDVMYSGGKLFSVDCAGNELR